MKKKMSKTLYKKYINTKCSGGFQWTECGNEYDCDSVHYEDCNNCTCCGGRYDPDTGKRISWWKKIIQELYFIIEEHPMKPRNNNE